MAAARHAHDYLRLRPWAVSPGAARTDDRQVGRYHASPMRGTTLSYRSRWSERRRPWLLIVPLVCWILMAGILAGDSVPAASSTSGPISWSPCPKAAGYLCGTLPVPIDYGDPSRGSLRLSLIEHPVPNSRGVIAFNPGGPGESGVLILPVLASLVPLMLASFLLALLVHWWPVIPPRRPGVPGAGCGR